MYDLYFQTPTSSFKNLLAILPSQYAGNLETIKTEGDFQTTGLVKGLLSKLSKPDCASSKCKNRQTGIKFIFSNKPLKIRGFMTKPNGAYSQYERLKATFVRQLS